MENCCGAQGSVYCLQFSCCNLNFAKFIFNISDLKELQVAQFYVDQLLDYRLSLAFFYFEKMELFISFSF